MNNKYPQIHFIYNRYKKATATRQAVVDALLHFLSDTTSS